MLEENNNTELAVVQREDQKPKETQVEQDITNRQQLREENNNEKEVVQKEVVKPKRGRPKKYKTQEEQDIARRKQLREAGRKFSAKNYRKIKELLKELETLKKNENLCTCSDSEPGAL